MDREQALQLVRQQIKGPRYEHTLRVVDTAVELAEKFGADRNKAELAAIFHDYAKLMPITELKDIIIKTKQDVRLLDYHPELWHGPVAAHLVYDKFGIDDESILNAIRFHTTGRANMTLFEKIIYLADYIEPGRKFPGVEKTRGMALVDLDQALLQALRNTITFLIDRNSPIFPDTFEAYNRLTMNKGGNND
ncbi:bis(5'-nucleosyl)-tetraphosphatase (symmetrical) YqeK [Lederbergia citrea]|uniref:bis(5'-nucleosyl)-tetraphosphatase (symmetrical) YqeK n=1 Tax=Lederbergia citrea TaxID=2833581 RepID=UPI001BC98525|nr:bis(5'-nucleosyl)-tetraphosphatase (symmetrical) YqeK [Lederbergia citrea]MBS4176267.1 bis(5'-nucleosyl)-tetraphosphatase (symmetrical) YqeK [Lederbergia citrea]MBS4202827.1 bis(5'-nucleosyl)-tetraphosphatase (symmetrical) YqeK [Lederbergia citrea]